ncbi:hypothetical protein [Gordonia sp. VNK21]|uniref:hypothetical protein n=1 Tax=Gordonia sp. VNK21 TaxID=3382483 RepID=UPI0038D50845
MTDQETKVYKPDPANRPTQVMWALRLWLISGALLIALGVWGVVATMLDTGWDFGVIAVAVLFIVVGAAYIVLSRNACTIVQWRGALAALTCVVVAMLLVLTIGFADASLALVLAASVVGLFGSLLAYRPEADAWFTGRDLDSYGRKARKERS